MLMHMPSATIRTQVSLPLRFADGYARKLGCSASRGS